MVTIILIFVKIFEWTFYAFAAWWTLVTATDKIKTKQMENKYQKFLDEQFDKERIDKANKMKE